METVYSGYMSEKATGTPERSEQSGPERGRQGPSGLLLRHPDGSSFRFDPGALCLELLPTGGPGPLSYFEVLHEPADLVRWAEESRLPGGLGPGDGSGSGPAIVVSAAEVADARVLRDALWRLAGGHVDGVPPAPDDLAVLNDAAAHPPLAARLTVGGDREWAPGGTGTGLLSTVARDAVDLLTGAYAHRIRACGAHGCRLLFVDTSRPGRRRWCSMERCGNRHKVRAHRARLTADGE
jgi:predicted RNA-binding Zn ribbon-like protein